MDRLLGTWATTMRHVQIAEPVQGRQTYERVLDGAFVRLEATSEHPEVPDGLALLDDEHYWSFDVRGVVRRFALQVTDSEWSIERQDDDFWQRARTTFVKDDRMEGVGENSYDHGATWQHDFTMTYERTS